MSGKWTVTFQVFRLKDEQEPSYQNYSLEVDPDEYILDAIERIWAFHDRTLCYRHACHHSTCGACGMRVNHVEKFNLHHHHPQRHPGWWYGCGRTSA